jgi:AraC family transcriptional regulator
VIYTPTHFDNFSSTNEFEKWAAVEVTSFNKVPSGMETFLLDGGLYAVFDYKGLNTVGNTKTTTPIQKKRFGYQ